MFIQRRTTDQLRQLAGWYRDFAERAGSPIVWESRMRMAEDFEDDAERMARRARSHLDS